MKHEKARHLQEWIRTQRGTGRITALADATTKPTAAHRHSSAQSLIDLDEQAGVGRFSGASTAGFGARAGSGGHQVLWGADRVCGCGGGGPVEFAQL
ncbi:MAG TPA: hypothetical protein VN748_09600 [Pseudonocardiaceae bacterium]|nr:hypothetical protein [Pseudonocardiaceae bacterium]